MWYDICARKFELIPEKYSGVGKASGKICDATTYKAVSGVKILFRKGINNIYSEVAETIETDDSGKYETSDLPAGNYCAEVQGKGCISSYFNVKILGGKHMKQQNGIISKSIDSNQIRIVLTWGSAPKDIDAHMLCSLSNENKTGHVYYLDREFIREITNSRCIFSICRKKRVNTGKCLN